MSDYIQLFRREYGHEGISDETRDTLLHGQLQEGLCYAVMKAPAVSGSRTYPELSLAARNEEKRLAELARREYQRVLPTTESRREEPGYSRGLPTATGPGRGPPSGFGQGRGRVRGPPPGPGAPQQTGPRRCFVCDQPGHFARDCPTQREDNRVTTSQVSLIPGELGPRNEAPNLGSYLQSDSEDDMEVRQIRVTDRGSRQQYADVQLQGVPARGIVDSGSEISIMGKELFRKVAAVA